MYNIDHLIEANAKNRFKLLTLVGDDEAKKDKIINYLTKKDWKVYDVEEVVLRLADEIPESKIGLRLGASLDDWIKNREEQVILTNANILFSPELMQKNPVESFRYALRGKKEALLFLEARLRDDQAIYSTPDKPDYSVVDLSEVLYKSISDIVVGGE